MAFDIMHMKRIIRSWCVAEGITYEERAERLDVPMPTLKSWIYGTNRLALDDAARICDVFGKSLDELTAREPRTA